MMGVLDILVRIWELGELESMGNDRVGSERYERENELSRSEKLNIWKFYGWRGEM